MRVTVVGFLAIGVLVAGVGVAHSEGCADYPYSSGINIEDVQGGTKILATASVGVSFDDVDAVNDARDEAMLSAKAMIVSFLQEGIRSEETVNRAVNETKSMQGDTKQNVRNEVIDRVKKLASSASGMLRGALPLGDCYTAGKEYRVSVGLKPETIAAAGNTAAGISNSLSPPPAAAPTTPTAPAGTTDRANGTSTGQPLNRVPSFSNTNGLKSF